MKVIRLTMILSLMVILNSCGVITKTRYGNGFKLNIESNLFSKGDDKKTSKSKKPLKIKDEACKTEVQVSSNKIENNDDIRIEDVITEPEIIQKSNAVTSKKPFAKSKNLAASNEKSHASSAEKTTLDAQKQTIEPNTEIAAWLFYGSIVGNIALAYAQIMIPFIGEILAIMMLIGIVLAFVGLRKIRLSGDKYRGYGIAMSIIIIFSIIMVLAIISFILLFAFLL